MGWDRGGRLGQVGLVWGWFGVGLGWFRSKHGCFRGGFKLGPTLL